MYQKKALAIAIAATLPMAASAATITDPDKEYANEVLQTVDFLLNADVEWTSGAATGVGDDITFTFSHPPVRSESGLAFDFPSTITCETAGEEASGVLGLDSQSATSVVYTVTTEVAEGDVCAIGTGIDIATSGVDADDDVTVSSATTSAAGISRGDDAEAALLFEAVGDEFSGALSDLGATINVEATVPQQEFDAAAESGDTALAAGFTLTMGVAAAGEGADQSAALGNFAITLTGGDFAWLDDDGDTSEGIVTTGIAATAGAGAITVGEIDVAEIDAGTISIPFTFDAGVADDDDVTVTLTGPGGVTIPEQDIAVSVTAAAASDADINLLTITGTDSYASNGSTVSVYAVPVTNSVQNFIYLNNTSSASGEVSVTVYDDGNVYGPYSIGTVEANSTFDVGARFQEPVGLDGNILSGNRIRLDVITELPERNVAISAAYKVTSANDRVNLLTSNESEHDN